MPVSRNRKKSARNRGASRERWLKPVAAAGMMRSRPTRRVEDKKLRAAAMGVAVRRRGTRWSDKKAGVMRRIAIACEVWMGWKRIVFGAWLIASLAWANYAILQEFLHPTPWENALLDPSFWMVSIGLPA